MAVDRSAVRRDLPYLRRRVKPVTAVPVVPVIAVPVAPTVSAGSETAAPAGGRGLDLGSRPSTAGSGGLDLGSRPSSARAEAAAPPAPRASGTSTGTSNRQPRRPPLPQPFPAPSVRDLRELGDDEPVVRLNARESAVGSLIVSGASAIVWESDELITGSALPDGTVDGTPVVTSGNRALVGFDDGDAIVSLRHLHRLRRALFVGGASETLGVQLFDGSSFTVSMGDGSRMFVLSLLRIDNVVELRAEPVTRDSAAGSIFTEFGFTLTAHLTPREPRRR